MLSGTKHRKIIHVDMDAFFASVEQRDFPEIKGKPVAVGGAGPRSVIAAASYEARAYGIRSAMPTKIALAKCPHLIMKPHRFRVYKEVSRQIREIFSGHTDLIEPLSLDEAFLDVTENKQGIQSAIYIAQLIKKEILNKTELTATAGVSANKFVAKVASGMNKPNGLTVILPEEIPAFIEKLPIKAFFGVGKATQKKMEELGIHTGYDLKQYSEIDLVKSFGKMGRYFYNISRGIDHREVKPDRIRKSVSSERTFTEDLTAESDIIEKLKYLSEDVSKTMVRLNKKAKTIQIKVRFENFETLTRQRTIDQFTDEYDIIFDTAIDLYNQLENSRPVRLLGVGMVNIEEEDTGQLAFEF